jgi:molybdopterin-guanine dinucleotide biosynthesis protein A
VRIDRATPSTPDPSPAMNSTRTSSDYPRAAITGVVLAGGLGSRMGGIDKGLVTLAGQPMIAHVIAALRPQVGELLINANRNRVEYAALGCRVVPDDLAGYPGPLAGFLSALRATETPYVLVVPCDAPLLPADLGARLHAALVNDRAEIAAAHDGDRLHPVFALLTRGVEKSLADYLDAGERKAETWIKGQCLASVDFSDRPEAFANVNRPEDRAALERRLRPPDPE